MPLTQKKIIKNAPWRSISGLSIIVQTYSFIVFCEVKKLLSQKTFHSTNSIKSNHRKPIKWLIVSGFVQQNFNHQTPQSQPVHIFNIIILKIIFHAFSWVNKNFPYIMWEIINLYAKRKEKFKESAKIIRMNTSQVCVYVDMCFFLNWWM